MVTITMLKNLEVSSLRSFPMEKDLSQWSTNVTRLQTSSNLSLTHWTGTRMHDGFPFLFTNKVSKQRGIFCLYPKAGSTNIKFLLRVASQYNMTNILNENPHSTYTSNTLSKMRSAIDDKSVPRYLVVRNPYSRLLSGYIDKILNNKEAQFMPPGFKINGSFPDFVEKLIRHHRKTSLRDFNDHFRLMTTSCLLPRGFEYDYILPLEHFQFWYEPMAVAMDLVAVSRTGWNVSTRWYRGDPDRPCFYAPEGKSCDDMFPSVRYKKGQTVRLSHTNASEAEVVTNTHTFHITHSVDKLQQYFNNATLLDLVTEWVTPDLKFFNYPVWQSNITAEGYIHLVAKRDTSKLKSMESKDEALSQLSREIEQLKQANARLTQQNVDLLIELTTLRGRGQAGVSGHRDSDIVIA